MDDLIEKALHPVFEGVTFNQATIDFYQEVQADIRESAQSLQAEAANLTDREAVNTAISEMGDLREVVLEISNDADQLESTDLTTSAYNNLVTDSQANLKKYALNQVQAIQIQATAFTELNIEGTQGTEVLVNYQVQHINRMPVIERQGNLLRIIGPKVAWHHYVPMLHPKIVINVKIPESFVGDVQLSSHNQAMLVHDLSFVGRLDIDSRSGVTRLNHVAVKGLQLNAHSGSVSVNGLKAVDMTFKVASGSFNANQIESEKTFKVDAKSGIVRVQNIKAPMMDVNAHSGQIRLRNIEGAGNFDAHSGAIKLDFIHVPGNINVNAHSGSIKLSLPTNDDFSVVAQADSGTVVVRHALAKVDLQTRSAVSGAVQTGQAYTVRAKSDSGRVVID